MQRVKRRIFSGVVCEQEVYTVSDRANIKKAEPRPRFKDDEERAQHRIGISKRKHQRLVNENFSPLSLYSTLTFDDDSEVHTFSEARRIRDNYFRRLQRACPDAKIIIYMGRGKSTNRIHFHMISDGIPEETISGKWNDGSVIHIRHLREHNYYNGVDYGQDYTGLADYLFNHWTPLEGNAQSSPAGEGSADACASDVYGKESTDRAEGLQAGGSPRDEVGLHIL